MAFIIPATVKCPKCSYTGYASMHTGSAIYCPQCFDEFIKQHVPRLEPDHSGKKFDPNAQFNPA
jgi:protein-arginine kinase activator protein McsA